jgi:hypothetical protein
MVRHLKKNNETYWKHLCFAWKVGFNLTFIGLVFICHGLLPLFKIPKRWNLRSTTKKLHEWNKYTIRRLRK